MTAAASLEACMGDAERTMENVSCMSSASDERDNATDDRELNLYLAHIRYVALKLSYIVIGTVGVIDNLFVIVVFALFIKITDKVTNRPTDRLTD